ncbi:MAG: 50S ribosomal protein L9 [Gammaproteobacteria bacterium]|jgi:large subunit ribosomal protein L9|nr:50S ribosomal protein L9 [Gammaproteobacteria bacterium]
MEVILLEKVQNLGDLGDKVKVKPGYGRNYLVPSGKATPATAENVALFEQRRAELEKAQAERLGTAEARAVALRDTEVTIKAKAGTEGKLYGSVGTREIADAVSATGVALEKHEVLLPDGALREIGEHEVALHLHSDLDLSIKVVVEAEE